MSYTGTTVGSIPRRNSPVYAPQASRPFNSASEVGVGAQQASYFESSYTRADARAGSQFQSNSVNSSGGSGSGLAGGSRGRSGGGGGGPPPPDDGPPVGRPDEPSGSPPSGGHGDLTVSGGGGPSGNQPSDLIDFLSSNWLNLTVVTQPDMISLLKHPAFRKVIATIARSAMEKLVEDMRSKMEAMVTQMVAEALVQSMSTAEDTIENQMNNHLKPLARNTAAYSLSRLTKMQQPQVAAYNIFAPKIGAPIMDEDVD